MQAVCDHLCCFTYFASASPGSVNDHDAIKGTSLPLLLHNVPAGFVIIGDAAYKASEKIVSLFYGVDVLVPENVNFYFFGSQCCVHIEMAFGMFIVTVVLWLFLWLCHCVGCCCVVVVLVVVVLWLLLLLWLCHCWFRPVVVVAVLLSMTFWCAVVVVVLCGCQCVVVVVMWLLCGCCMKLR